MNLLSVILASLLVILVILTGLFLAVMFLKPTEAWIFQLLGVTQKSEALKFLGIGMGGILLALQALASHTRAKAMEDTANAQAKATEQQAAANQNVERGQRQERLKNAIEHLGHQSDSVRLGGAYELFHLAQDTEDLRQTVLDILCAHVSQTTGENEYRKKHKSKPSEEVQSLLTLLFVQKHEVFKGLHINLRGSWLNGADLNRARLENAVLVDARLQKAELERAHLRKADLWRAHLQGARFPFVHMEGTQLQEAHMQGSLLLGSSMQGADLSQARLQGACLGGTRLQCANLWGAHLQGAQLVGGNLQEVQLGETQLQGVISIGMPPCSFEEQIRSQIGQNSDLKGAIFSGGLSRVVLDSLVEDLPDEIANHLRHKLMPHVDKPLSHQLPENSKAITGTYSAEEAEEWIAEYRKAT